MIRVVRACVVGDIGRIGCFGDGEGGAPLTHRKRNFVVVLLSCVCVIHYIVAFTRNFVCSRKAGFFFFFFFSILYSQTIKKLYLFEKSSSVSELGRITSRMQ